MQGRRPYEVLENGQPLYGGGRHFQTLGAARSWIARQLRPRSRSRRGWRVWWIRAERDGKPNLHTIRDNRSGRIFDAAPPNET